MSRNFYFCLGATVFVVLSYFSPWITEDYAKLAALNGFNLAWREVTDGCGSDKTYNSTKVPFGRNVDIDYACGLLPYDSPEFHQKTEVFVSFIGTVHIEKSARP